MLNSVLHIVRCALLSGIGAAEYPAYEAEGGGIISKPCMSSTLIGK